MRRLKWVVLLRSHISQISITSITVTFHRHSYEEKRDESIFVSNKRRVFSTNDRATAIQPQ